MSAQRIKHSEFKALSEAFDAGELRTPTELAAARKTFLAYSAQCLKSSGRWLIVASVGLVVAFVALIIEAAGS